MVERLQGWDGPEYEWNFVGRKTSHYRQIGNAFPPPVARALGTSIRRALLREGKPTAVRAEGGLHDDVYRALRDADQALTLRQIQRVIGDRLTAPEIEERLAHLSADFDLQLTLRGGRPAWMLGEFKAFLGQAEHPRHGRFATARKTAS